MPLSAASPDPASAAPALSLDAVTVHHRDAPASALVVPRLTIAPGETVAVAGPSGAGKSTLLHLAAGLTRPTAGAVLWGMTRIDRLADRARDRLRLDTVGFVFQDFHLVDELSVLDNVLLPARFDRFRLPAGTLDHAHALVARVGLSDPKRLANRLSRGERQRVAVARALLRRPHLLLADEPTASLDRDTAASIADLLFDVAAETGATLIMATHDPALLARFDRVLRLSGGRIASEETP